MCIAMSQDLASPVACTTADRPILCMRENLDLTLHDADYSAHDLQQDWLQSSGIIASHTCGGHRMGGLSGIAAGLKDDRYIVHVEYKGKGWPCGFLGDKNALSGGWVAFAKANVSVLQTLGFSVSHVRSSD